MKKVFFLIFIILILTSCKDLDYKFNKTGVEIINAEFTNIPNGQLEFYSLYRGESPLNWEKEYLESVTLQTGNQTINIQGINPNPNVHVDVNILTNYLTDNTILYKQDIIQDYKLYLNYPQMLRQIDVLDTLIIKELIDLEENDNFAQNIIEFVKNIPDNGNEKLFILFIDKNRVTQDNYFEYNFNRLNSIANQHSNWWFGVFFEGSLDKRLLSADIQIPENCLFVEQIKKISFVELRKQTELITNSIDRIKNSKYIADFTFSDKINPQRTSYNIDLISTMNENELLQDSITLNVSSEEIRDYYFTIIQNWFTENSGIEKIETDYSVGLDWISFAQQYWNMNNYDWYNPAKMQFLLEYAAFQKNYGYGFDDRISIYNEILSIDSDHIETKFNLFECKGDKANSLNKKEDALSFFQQALNVKVDAQLRSKLIQNLKSLMKLHYNTKSYNSLNRVAKNYSGYIINNFEYRFYWAVAAKVIHDTKQALHQYNWLLDHWNSKITYVSWNDILHSLLDLHAEGMDFENAYNLLKRISINKLSKQIPDMIYAFSYLRGQYLKPVTLASKVLLSSDGQYKSSLAKTELAKTALPQYLSSIYLMKNNRIDNILYKHKIAELPLRNVTGSGFVNNNISNWFVSATNYTKFVIQTNNDFSSTEEVMYHELQKNYSTPGLWFALEEYMYNNEKPTVTKLLSIIMGIDFGHYGAGKLANYQNAIAAIPFIQYCVVQNDRQQIVYNYHFELNKAAYLQEGWTRSSQAILLYQQEINYNGKSIIDITYPMYYNGRYVGVLRLGFNKI